MSNASSKPRKKPQFLHLHPIQAAKAKQAWVNKAKLRSQWAKQKRNLPADSSDPHQQEEMDVDGDKEERHERQSKQPTEEVKVAEEPVIGPSRKRMRSSRSEVVAHHKPAAKRPSAPVDERERRERVRNLSREAYAPDSLHTFKADPLHRQRSHGHAASRGRAPGTGTISQFSRGRGQPNMKLRMNALLEKIKLDAGVS